MKKLLLILGTIMALSSPSVHADTLELTKSPKMANPVGTDILPLVRTDPTYGPTLFQVTMSDFLKSVTDLNAVHKGDDISSMLMSPNYGPQDTLTNIFSGINNRINTLVGSTVVRSNGTATGLTINYGNYNSGIADNVDLSDSYATISGTGGQTTLISSMMSGTYGMSTTDKRGISIYYNTTGGMPYLRYDGGSIGLLPASGGTGNDNIFLRPTITKGSLTGTDISAANLSSTLSGAQAAVNIAANAAAITAETARATTAESAVAKSSIAIVGSANGGAGSTSTDTIVSSIGVNSTSHLPWLYLPSTGSYVYVYPTTAADAKFVSITSGSSTNQSLTSPVVSGGSLTNSTLTTPTINDGTLIDTDISGARLTGTMSGKDAATQITANTAAIANESTRAAAAEAKLAPLDSPVFTGNPQVPTVAQGDNSSRTASTGYVDTGLNNLKGNMVARSGGVSTNQILTTPELLDAVVSPSGGSSTLFFNGSAGSSRAQIFQTSGSPRFTQGVTGDAESGSSLGSNFFLDRTDDSGNESNVYTVSRQTGIVSYAQTPTMPSPSTTDNSNSAATTAYINSYMAERFVDSSTTLTVCASGCMYNTVQDAWAAAIGKVSVNESLITIQISDGTYHIPSSLGVTGGSGRIALTGNPSSPQNVVLIFDPTGAARDTGINLVSSQLIISVVGVTLSRPLDGTAEFKSGDFSTYTSAVWSTTNISYGVYSTMSGGSLHVENSIISGFSVGVYADVGSMVGVGNTTIKNYGIYGIQGYAKSVITADTVSVVNGSNPRNAIGIYATTGSVIRVTNSSVSLAYIGIYTEAQGLVHADGSSVANTFSGIQADTNSSIRVTESTITNASNGGVIATNESFIDGTSVTITNCGTGAMASSISSVIMRDTYARMSGNGTQLSVDTAGTLNGMSYTASIVYVQ